MQDIGLRDTRVCSLTVEAHKMVLLLSLLQAEATRLDTVVTDMPVSQCYDMDKKTMTTDFVMGITVVAFSMGIVTGMIIMKIILL